MKIKLDEGAYIPSRAHSTDAGLDLYARETKDIPAGQSVVFDTGVHVQLPPSTAGILISKSGLNVRHDLTSTGLIDEGYDGAIAVKLYNHGGTPYTVVAGDKISQLVVVPVIYANVEIVEDFGVQTARGSNGFGSSGK